MKRKYGERVETGPFASASRSGVGRNPMMRVSLRIFTPPALACGRMATASAVGLPLGRMAPEYQRRIGAAEAE
jgi:hypothetical protein